ncbi:MAG TPA: transcriptional repressor [Rectinemataceae bacterium]|nr:transcriptional repressor [Rectinemataceae bacterium]
MDDSQTLGLLAASGLRPTKSREAVLGALLASGKPLSHPELASRLETLDRVTIFRSLKTLRASGLLHSVRGLDGLLRFVVNPSRNSRCPGSHPHFLCLSCGTMTCLETQELPKIEVPVGAEVRGKQFLVYGQCASCAKAGAEARAPRNRGAKNKAKKGNEL